MNAAPLRVLHVHSGNIYGGIETMLATIARRQGDVPGTRHAFVLCFPGRCADELAAAGALVASLGAVRVRHPWTVLTARRRLATLLRTDRPDVVVTHSPWAHALFAPVVRSAGVPIVFSRHSASDGRHWLERWARRTPPDHVMADSAFAASSSHTLFPGVPADSLYYPVEPARPEARTARGAVRSDLGAAEDRTVIVQASRMEPWKGQAVLVEALGLLRSRDDWACWIAGGAQRPHERVYARALAARAEALGIAARIRFLGLRGDVPDLLAAADLFCQPNAGPEPFGNVFVEALAHGLPVVTTTIGAGLEIVTPSCGVLVPARDPVALAEALRGLLDDPTRRAALGAAGPARAAELCDPARQLARLGDLLRSVSGRELRAPEGHPR